MDRSDKSSTAARLKQLSPVMGIYVLYMSLTEEYLYDLPKGKVSLLQLVTPMPPRQSSSRPREYPIMQSGILLGSILGGMMYLFQPTAFSNMHGIAEEER